MSIFKKHCLAYLKKGYSVIPDSPPVAGSKKKKPAIRKWPDYCKRLPNKEEIQSWINIKDANIAIALGEASGIIALDFDETDPEIIAMIEHLLPKSPVERVGKKGWARLFRYSGEATEEVFFTTSENKKHVVVELLSNKKKITIPPSIHVETLKPYTWSSKELLEVDKNTLPKLPPFLMEKIRQRIEGAQITTFSLNTMKVTEGRTISLRSEAARIISNPHTIEDAISKLVEYDKSNHEKPLFSDLEDLEFNDPKLNALMFYNSILRSINLKRRDKKETLEVPIFDEPKISDEVGLLGALLGNNKNEEKKIDDEIPIPTGVLKLLYDHILENSYIPQPVFAISASLALIGVLVSRKVIFQNATANMYLLNIGESGTGKDCCQEIVKKLLHKIQADHLLGATAYPSEASIIQHLGTRQVRLDIIDEASTFLKTATSGGSEYANGIGDTLCELFSCASSFYLGKSLASKPEKIGQCERPHVNLLCATTPRGLKESVSTTALEKGLFARFLTFFGDNSKKGKRSIRSIKPSEELLTHLKRWHKFENPSIIKGGNLTAITRPSYKIPCTRGADNLLQKYYNEFDKMRIESRCNNTQRPIIARLYQHMLKMVLLSCISNTSLDKLPLVKPNDVEFGYKMIKYYYAHIKGFVSDNLYETQRGMKLNKVLGVIKDHGEEGITAIELVNACKFLSAFERKDIISDLMQMKRIIPKTEDKTNELSFYYLEE